jgi:hypothetical protein
VLVVWEPILETDGPPPSGSTLNRIVDRRALQFWDPNHMVAKALIDIAKKNPPKPEPECCVQDGFYWDEAILYPSGKRWTDEPSSIFWNGPIVRMIPALKKTFTN